MGTKPRPNRRVRHATVVAHEWLCPSMVRVVLGGPDLVGLGPLPFTDHYVKLLFPPADADYCWPFDPHELRSTRPAAEWPLTRTYTIRRYDPRRAEMTLDFVVHGNEGLAGPWARSARIGDPMVLLGPGGAYAPTLDADGYLLVGDESALPAIAVTLERLPAEMHAEVYVEVAGPADEQPLRQAPGISVQWVHRGAAPYGSLVGQAVRSRSLPEGRLSAFVHGNAALVSDIRRYLLVEQEVERQRLSISGYWRTGRSEGVWPGHEVPASNQPPLAVAS